MKSETLKLVKKSYENIKNQQLESKRIWDRIDDLEQNELVKEYIKLTNKVKMIDKRKKYLTEEEILEICVAGFLSSLNETNDIYVFIGEMTLQIKAQQRTFKRYVNLESSTDNQLIPIEQSSEFEKNHHTIKVDSYETYKQLQKEFLRFTIKEGQEVACKKILTKKY